MATDSQSRPVNMVHQKSLNKWARSPVVKVRRYTDDTVSSLEPPSCQPPSRIRKSALVSKPSLPRRWGTTLSGRQQNSAALVSQDPPNVLEWLQVSCPVDVIPKVLAFAGPQMMSRLNQTNRFFHETMKKEETWRVVCEELYKVSYMLISPNFSISIDISLFSMTFSYRRSGNPATKCLQAGSTCINGRLVFLSTTRPYQRRFRLLVQRPSANKIKSKYGKYDPFAYCFAPVSTKSASQ